MQIKSEIIKYLPEMAAICKINSDVGLVAPLPQLIFLILRRYLYMLIRKEASSNILDASFYRLRKINNA